MSSATEAPESLSGRLVGAIESVASLPGRALGAFRRRPMAGDLLAVEIATFRDDVAFRIRNQSGATAGALADAADEGARAAEAYAAGHPLAARRFLMAARVALVPALTDGERDALAITMQAEAHRLPAGWQPAAIEALLASPIDCSTTLRAAMEIRDRALLDMRLDTVRRRAQSGRRLVALIAIIAAVIVLAFIHTIRLDPPTLVGVTVFGALGGAFSTAVATHQGDSAPLPHDPYMSNWITWARPAIGAAGAIGAYAFLSAGAGVTPTTPLAIYAIAFAAGFSERLVSNAAEGATIP